jgi:ribonucleoside-diphosphate reductase alpha chain
MIDLFDLFSEVETTSVSKTQESSYSKLLENRVRPNESTFDEKNENKYIVNSEAQESKKEIIEEKISMTTTQNSDNPVEKKAYNNEETLATATEYFHGDTLAASVWMNKYALKDSYGNVYELTPNDMHRRLAKEFARIEAKYPNPLSEEKIYNLLKDFKYIVPQGSPMTGIGNDFQIASLSNCFVIGNNGSSDSYGGIMKVDEEQVQLMKRRGGVGHDLSHIRPTGSPVKNSALTSTGIVPFMERYSNSTREVAQDGRRGALMLSISVKHPDAERFIDAKMTQGKVTGANQRTQHIPKKLMQKNFGINLFIMHGLLLNLVFYFGTPSFVSQFPILMQI